MQNHLKFLLPNYEQVVCSGGNTSTMEGCVILHTLTFRIMFVVLAFYHGDGGAVVEMFKKTILKTKFLFVCFKTINQSVVV